MIFTLLALSSAALSAGAAALVVFKFCRDWDIRVSSVRWLFTVFFLYLFVYTTARVGYYSWLAALLAADPALRSGDSFTVSELDRLGIHAVVYMQAAGNGWMTTLVVLGDVALFGAAFWVFALTYELSKLLSATMDCGPANERAKIRVYAWLGHALIAAFAIVEIALAISKRGYSSSAHALLLSVYTVQIFSLVYMAAILVTLKWKGRDVESVHGRFVLSPIYRRLRAIMVVYAVFALEFQLSSVILYIVDDHSSAVLDYLGISVVFYMGTVFALSIVTGCSLDCVLRACPWLVEHAMPEQLEILTDGVPAFEMVMTTTIERLGPWNNPVFVFTDIESSSALWAIGDGRVMQKAVQIHDDILRSRLAPHRGYEITTAGDAFQLAFHTMREAAEYCIDVQNRLLAADWPDELHNMVPATAKERWGHRYVFRGLRVRMGIHDAAECEGPLVVDVHAVTGKTTYTGASEVVASSVGDLGAGGQIVATRRVAEWLEQHSELVDEQFEVDFLCELVVPQVNVRVELFQIIPKQLRARRHWFDGETPPDVVAKSRSRRLKLPIGGGFSGNPEFETVELSVSSSGSWHWSPRPSDHHARSSL